MALKLLYLRAALAVQKLDETGANQEMINAYGDSLYKDRGKMGKTSGCRGARLLE